MSKNIVVKHCAETKLFGKQLPLPNERKASPSEEAILAIIGLPFVTKNLEINLGGCLLESEGKTEFAFTQFEQRAGYSISTSNHLEKDSFFYASSIAKDDELSFQDFKQRHIHAHFFVKKGKSVQAVYLIEGCQVELQQLKDLSKSTGELNFTFCKSFKIKAGVYSINLLAPAINMYKFASYFGIDEALKPTHFRPREIKILQLSKERMPSLLYQFSMAQRIGTLETYDYVFATTMSFIGAMIAKVLVVSVDHSSSLAPIIWSVSIGEPGTGKTPTQNAVLNLFNRLILSQEVIETKSFSNEVQKLADKAIISEVTAEIKQALKFNTVIDADALMNMRESLEIKSNQTSSKKHIGRVLIVTDTTSAGLVDLLSGDLFSVILHSDELGSTLKLLKNVNNATLRGQLMQSESGNGEIKKARADRYSSVESAAVAMIANIQPDLMMTEVKGLSNGNDGLINRFQIAVYNATSRQNYIENTDGSADEQMLKFLFTLKKYLADLYKSGGKVTFKLSANALKSYKNFMSSLSRHVESNVNHPIYAAHVSKYSGTTLKIALVYQLILNYESGRLNHKSDTVVSLKALKFAKKTIIYLSSHAKKAFKENNDILHKEAESLLFKLLELSPGIQFTASNIAQKNWRGINRDTDKAEKLLEYLLSFGLVTREADCKKILWKVRPTTKYMFKH